MTHELSWLRRCEQLQFWRNSNGSSGLSTVAGAYKRLPIGTALLIYYYCISQLLFIITSLFRRLADNSTREKKKHKSKLNQWTTRGTKKL